LRTISTPAKAFETRQFCLEPSSWARRMKRKRSSAAGVNSRYFGGPAVRCQEQAAQLLVAHRLDPDARAPGKLADRHRSHGSHRSDDRIHPLPR
jgi:hypothetical protein